MTFAIEEKSDVFEPPPPPPGRYSYGPRYEHRPNGKLVLAILEQWAALDEVDADPRFKDWLYLAERRVEALENKARAELLARRQNLSYSSPLRQRFAWAGEASTADLVNVVLFPYRQKPDDPDDPDDTPA